MTKWKELEINFGGQQCGGVVAEAAASNLGVGLSTGYFPSNLPYCCAWDSSKEWPRPWGPWTMWETRKKLLTSDGPGFWLLQPFGGQWTSEWKVFLCFCLHALQINK